MVADSPYRTGELALRPRDGIATGILAVAPMLGLIHVLQPLSRLSLSGLTLQVGAVVFRADAVWGESLRLATGAALFAIVGALVGLLYAACQQRAPVRGLLGVGLFYGFVLWVVGSLLAGIIGGDALRAVLRSWPWLLACLFYGLSLAAATIAFGLRRPPKAIIPMD